MLLDGPARLLRAPVAAATRATLAKAFGPPPFDPTQPPGDPGLLGADAASWQVIGDVASIAGGVRALWVQLLHPLAMAGVAQHSRFREDPLGRLQGTSAYVTSVAFGSTADGLAVTRRVRAVHRGVHGVAADGRTYAADDPELLAWVSLALTWSFLASDRAYAAEPVGPEVADRFVAEQSRAAALLDPRVDLDALTGDPDALVSFRRGDLPLPLIDDGALPTDVAGVEAAVARYRADLRVDADGREGLAFLRWPPLPLSLKAAYVPLAAGALATVPRDLRAMLGVPTSRSLAAAARLDTRTRLRLLRAAAGPSPVVAAVRARVAPQPSSVA